MSDSSEQRRNDVDARDNRRWLIGVGISVGFGLFGVVMALLSYSHRSTPTSVPAARIPAAHASGERAHQTPRHRR